MPGRCYASVTVAGDALLDSLIQSLILGSSFLKEALLVGIDGNFLGLEGVGGDKSLESRKRRVKDLFRTATQGHEINRPLLHEVSRSLDVPRLGTTTAVDHPLLPIIGLDGL